MRLRIAVQQEYWRSGAAHYTAKRGTSCVELKSGEARKMVVRNMTEVFR